MCQGFQFTSLFSHAPFVFELFRQFNSEENCGWNFLSEENWKMLSTHGASMKGVMFTCINWAQYTREITLIVRSLMVLIKSRSNLNYFTTAAKICYANKSLKLISEAPVNVGWVHMGDIKQVNVKKFTWKISFSLFRFSFGILTA